MREITDRLHENRQIELAKSILESHGYNISKVNESETTGNKFIVGDMVEYSGLYGGSYRAKVTHVGEHEIKMDVSWIAEDTGEVVVNHETFEKTTDEEGNECIVVWTYYEDKGYVYPPERQSSENSEEMQESITDNELFDIKIGDVIEAYNDKGELVNELTIKDMYVYVERRRGSKHYISPVVSFKSTTRNDIDVRDIEYLMNIYHKLVRIKPEHR